MKLVKEKIPNKPTPALIVVMAIVVALVFFSAVIFRPAILNGVSVNGIDVGGMTKKKAAMTLNEAIDTATGGDIKFTYGDNEFAVNINDIKLHYDVEKTVDEAYNLGRDKNILKRISNIISFRKNKRDIPFVLSYDKEILNALINANLGDSIERVIEYTAELEGNRLCITNGIDGYTVDEKKLEEDLQFVLGSGNFDDAISLEIVEAKAKEIDVDEFFETYNTTAKDARYDEETEEYTDEVIGVKFSKESARDIIEANRDNSEPYYLDVDVTYPKVTSDSLQDKLFSDNLGTYTSYYNAGEVGRTKNVSLAARKINGVVLSPGQKFSYNTVVGERTIAAGFAEAKVYEGGNVVAGLGGGICQVSSTLYNAVLYADLEIVSRTNHSLPVAYVPLGRDATVSYGLIDFVFKNNYSSPVKIKASASGGTLTVSVYGKKLDNKKVSLSTETVSTIPFETREVEDADLSEGQTYVSQSGTNGAVVKTYRTVTVNGKTTTTLLHTSRYNPINKIVKVAPKPDEPDDMPTDTPGDVPGDTPSDTPDDTPTMPPDADIGQDNPVEPPSEPVVPSEPTAPAEPSDGTAPDVPISDTQTTQ